MNKRSKSAKICYMGTKLIRFALKHLHILVAKATSGDMTIVKIPCFQTYCARLFLYSPVFPLTVKEKTNYRMLIVTISHLEANTLSVTLM